ncbi:MAG: hypothetical protein VYA95_00125, partial [Candidatus Thermoplasmatota archaeon]|nr:hypothetical protein [Candidatus Thermoplasmatota archaeon]
SALCWGIDSNTPVYTFSSVYQYAKPGDPIINLPAHGSISASLEFDFVNMRLMGDWQASNLVTGYDYNVSWSLKYQNNGTVISNGLPDSFHGNSPNQSAAVRSWWSGFLYGETICYEITLRYGDGLTGTALDNSTSCTNTPIQLSSLSSNEVLGAVQRSSSGNCEASSSASSISSARICDNNTGTEWVSGSETNNAEEEITIDFDLGSTPVKVNAVAAYVNNAGYMSTIKNVRLQYLNETGDYQTIGIFQIQQAVGWQFFGGFSVMTTEIRWDILTNHGYYHTVLFEGRILDVPDKIFNSSADWSSSNSYATRSVAWGDVDGDGDLDLVSGNGGSDNKEIHLNSGTGLATTPAWTSSNSSNTYSVAWGDVD